MKLRVFVSWSGERSRLLARAFSDWLPNVIQAADPWMSQTEIDKGQRWSTEVGESLSEHDLGVVCVTPENLEAKWLLFEAGALSKAIRESRVCPLLLGMRPSDLDGPLSQFQATVVERGDMLSLVESLNARLDAEAVDNPRLHRAFDRSWPDFESAVRELTNVRIAPNPTNLPSVIRIFAKNGFPEPAVGSSAYFSSGFESHSLYTTLSGIVKERLYVFGRKNRKLFDKEHADFLGSLKERVKAGFDFRCLFLSPDAPRHVIEGAHEDADFLDQLRRSLSNAMNALEVAGLDPRDHFRLYSTNRVSAFVVADDALLYTPIRLTGLGRAARLTKCGFTIMNASSQFGEQALSEFMAIWNEGSVPKA